MRKMNSEEELIYEEALTVLCNGSDGSPQQITKLAKYLRDILISIEDVKDLIYEYGGIDGDHHKQWLLDQILQILLSENDYNEWLKDYNQSGYDEWNKGIAP